jgi:hypothetical protein
MQDAIAGKISNRLQRQFVTGATQRVAKRGTNNPEAYRLYLQGMYLANKRILADARAAIQVLEQAVSLDPNYALLTAAGLPKLKPTNIANSNAGPDKEVSQ